MLLRKITRGLTKYLDELLISFYIIIVMYALYTYMYICTRIKCHLLDFNMTFLSLTWLIFELIYSSFRRLRKFIFLILILIFLKWWYWSFRVLGNTCKTHLDRVSGPFNPLSLRRYRVLIVFLVGFSHARTRGCTCAPLYRDLWFFAAAYPSWYFVLHLTGAG